MLSLSVHPSLPVGTRNDLSRRLHITLTTDLHNTRSQVGNLLVCSLNTSLIDITALAGKLLVFTKSVSDTVHTLFTTSTRNTALSDLQHLAHSSSADGGCASQVLDLVLLAVLWSGVVHNLRRSSNVDHSARSSLLWTAVLVELHVVLDSVSALGVSRAVQPRLLQSSTSAIS